MGIIQCVDFQENVAEFPFHIIQRRNLSNISPVVFHQRKIMPCIFDGLLHVISAMSKKYDFTTAVLHFMFYLQ